MKEPEFDPVGLLRALKEHRVRFVLIGGFAAALRGSPLITGDLDICYARDAQNLERLATALRALDARLRGGPDQDPFQLDARTLEAGDHFTFMTRFGAFDCLGTPAGTDGFPALDRSASDETVDGTAIRVASLDDLITMKAAADRPQDRIAIEWLSALRDETEA